MRMFRLFVKALQKENSSVVHSYHDCLQTLNNAFYIMYVYEIFPFILKREGILEGDTLTPPTPLRTTLFWPGVLRTVMVWPRVLRTV